MKPQVQSRIGKNGRCLNACLASILEIPEHSVPDFPDGDVYFPAIDAFLKPFGVHYIQRPITEAPPKNWHTIEGVSPRGGMHAVCGYNGKFKFDPHPVEDDPRRGLVKPERWGCLVPISEEVKPVGDGLLEQLCQKHDAIKWHPSRNDDLAVPLRSSEALQAYAHTHSDIVRLLQDAVSLLNKSSAVNKANWRGRVERVKKDVATAEAKARGGDYKGAVALQESALMLAHEILDELLRLSRSKAGDSSRFGICASCIKPIYKVGASWYHKDRKLDTDHKAVAKEWATDFLPQYGESSKPHKFVPMDNSTRFCKVCARPLAASCHSAPAKDGVLSNTAMLLAALYAWYRSRMDAPALQPRNYDLTTYVPRQRMLDSSRRGLPYDHPKILAIRKKIQVLEDRGLSYDNPQITKLTSEIRRLEGNE